MAIYRIVSSRAAYDLAQTDDLSYAGLIVDALMRAHSPDSDFWVIDEAGGEYYHDANFATVFSAACFEVAA